LSRSLRVVAAAAALALLGGLPAHADEPTGSLSVTVTDAVSGQPVPGACVDVSGPAIRDACSATGAFTFTDLPVGDYLVSASADELHGFGGVTTTVTEGATAVAVPLAPTGAVTVRAVDAATGAPLAGVCARIVATTSPGLAPQFGGDCTDAGGRVTVGRLAPGGYRVLAVPGDAAHGLQWVGTAGGTGRQENAATVRVRAGVVTAAPVARMDGAGTITGTVTAAGAPVATICTSPYAFAPGQGPDGGPQCTGEDGRYTLGGLGPYAWPVEFVDFGGTYAWEWSGNAAQRLAARAVKVRVGAPATADAALAPGGKLTGRITGQPYGTAFAYDTLSGDYAAAYGPSDEGGVYTIAGLATQDVKVQARGTGSSQRWFRDAAGFAGATPVAVRAGRTRTGVDVRLR
jgi:hypothetical protein